MAIVARTDFVCVVSLPKYLAPEALCTSVHSEPLYFDDDGCVCENFQDASFVYASSPRTDVWSVGIILLEFLLVSLAVLRKVVCLCKLELLLIELWDFIIHGIACCFCIFNWILFDQTQLNYMICDVWWWRQVKFVAFKLFKVDGRLIKAF